MTTSSSTPWGARASNPANVGAEVHVLEVDVPRGGVGAVDRGVQIRPGGGDAQHPAAVGEHRAVVSQFGARMENHGLLSGILQAGDGQTLGVGAGVAAGGQHKAAGRPVLPPDVQMVQSAVTAGQEDVQQIGLQQGEHRLAFGIAEAGIVLHHLGPSGVSIRPK